MAKKKVQPVESTKVKKHYFQVLIDNCEKLNEQGQAYLDTLPFIPSDEVAERIYKKGMEIFHAANEDWSAVPEWVKTVADGFVPYSEAPRNGSLRYALGWAMVSQEAHLRNLLERAEGRTTEKLDFEILADVNMEDCI